MRCANSLCRTETKYFRGGSLHCIDRCDQGEGRASGDHRQLVWLCPDCSRSFVVETWRPPGHQLIARRVSPHSSHVVQADLAVA